MLISAWWSLSFSFLLVLLHWVHVEDFVCLIWKVDPAVALGESACKLCFGCLGAGCIASPFFPPKVILPLDHVLELVCHLGVVIPPQWITKRLSDSSLTDSTCCPLGFCRGGHSWSKRSTWLRPLHRWSLNLHPHCWPLKS